MRTKSLGIIIVLSFSTLALMGSSFKVINIEGLSLAYNDIDRASDYASELKAREKDIPQKDFFRAKDKYIEAKNVLNGYLMKAITNAADYEVNNTKEEYLATGGPVKVDAFAREVKLLRPMGKKTVAPVVITIISTCIPVAVEAAKAIMDANQKDRDKGLDVFTKSVEKYMMKSFEEIPLGKVVKKGGT